MAPKEEQVEQLFECAEFEMYIYACLWTKRESSMQWVDDASQAREQDMLIRETGTVLSSADVGLTIGLIKSKANTRWVWHAMHA